MNLFLKQFFLQYLIIGYNLITSKSARKKAIKEFTTLQINRDTLVFFWEKNYRTYYLNLFIWIFGIVVVSVHWYRNQPKCSLINYSKRFTNAHYFENNWIKLKLKVLHLHFEKYCIFDLLIFNIGKKIFPKYVNTNPYTAKFSNGLCFGLSKVLNLKHLQFDLILMININNEFKSVFLVSCVTKEDFGNFELKHLPGPCLMVSRRFRLFESFRNDLTRMRQT